MGTTNNSKGICDYCLTHKQDKRRKEVYKCKYCGEFFCEEHKDAKLPSMAPFVEGITKRERISIEMEYRKQGHPCPPYVDVVKHRIEEKKIRWAITLDHLLEKPIEKSKLHIKKLPKIITGIVSRPTPPPRKKCKVCGKKEHRKLHIHTCSYCQDYVCDRHLKPEAHKCPKTSYAPKDTPLKPRRKCNFCGKEERKKIRVYTCIHCGHNFCDSHFKPEAHKCSKYAPEVTPSKHPEKVKSCLVCGKQETRKRKLRTCNFCKDKFCKKHIRYEAHSCPKCRKRIKEPPQIEPEPKKIVEPLSIEERTKDVHERITKPLITKAKIKKRLNQTKKILIVSVLLLFAVGIFQPNLLNDNAPEPVTPYVKKFTDTLNELKDKYFTPLFHPSNENIEVVDKTDKIEKIQFISEENPTILDPLPPRYHTEYSLKIGEYRSRDFPLPVPDIYTGAIVGAYGRIKEGIFEMEKKVYVFNFSTESEAEQFTTLMFQEYDRSSSDITPVIKQIGPLVVYSRYGNINMQYRGSFFNLKNYVYYVWMFFADDQEYKYIEETFLEIPQQIEVDVEKIEENLSNYSIKEPIERPKISIRIPNIKKAVEDFMADYQQKQELKTINESIEAIEYINNLRGRYSRQPLKWNEKLYELALFRAKDMYERNYFDHVTPEGKCANSFTSDFGIRSSVAENLGKGYYTHIEAIDGWMTSRGHRYNLLYIEHREGAIAKYGDVYVFVGTGPGEYGWVCATGEEGLDYWSKASKQPGEV